MNVNEKRIPCLRDCPGRAPGCHALCERYQVFQREREQIYAERMQRQTVKDFRDAGYFRELRRKNIKARR